LRDADIIWRVAICCIGFGLFQTPNMRALMSSAPAHRSGSAISIVATARLTGQTIGAALAALCFSRAGHDGAALALGAGFAGLGSVMSFLRLAAGAARLTRCDGRGTQHRTVQHFPVARAYS